jgi:predicted enzyme related to lactoylglutathione lyase
MTTGIRANNDFCWINMLTPQPAEAQRFFAALFDWTFTPMSPIAGWTIKVKGHDIGGMFDCDHPQTPKGTPPLIGVAVKVANADDFCVRAAALGGAARSPMDILDHGRVVVCHDPEGANIDAWQPRNILGTDVDSRAHGAFTWFQLMTKDVDRASKFYTSLFGWQARVYPERGGYVVFSQGDREVAGMMGIGPRTGMAKAGWTTWFSVDDVDETARRAQSLGGNLCVPPHDIPDIGRFAAVTSPTGVPFHAITWRR